MVFVNGWADSAIAPPGAVSGVGFWVARPTGMGVKRLEDLVALQTAVAFKEEVYAIVRAHPRAGRDLKYLSQLFDAVGSIEGNIAEGWGRRGAGQMCLFLGYAVGSVESALQHARHCGGATVNLKRSLEPFIPRKPKRTKRPKPGPSDDEA